MELKVRTHLTLRLWGGVFALACVALYGDGVAAQSAPAQPDDVIVVTGTRIPRPDLTSASPIAAFDRNDLNEFRAANLEDFINTLPQISPDFGRTTNNPGDGTASIDLRGLGRNRSLVLLNGRRLGPVGAGSAVDINTLPNAMIQRVEIVSGGASAVYGADAVAGAVNFITRSDFTGIELSGQFDTFGDGDGEVYNASIAAGTAFAGGSGHISIFADYLNRASVRGGAREFSSVAIGENRINGTLFNQGSPITGDGMSMFPPAIINGQPTNLIFNSDGTARAPAATDTFNFAADEFIQTPLERWSAGLFADLELAAGFEIYAELLYSRPETDQSLSATAGNFFVPFSVSDAFFDAAALPLISGTFDADMDGIGQGFLGRRFVEVGPRITTNERENYRAVFGTRVDITPGWSLDAHYAFMRNERTQSFANAVSQSRLRQGLLLNPATDTCLDTSNGCVPVNIFGAGNISDAAVNFIRLDELANETEATQHIASIVATGDLFSWEQGVAKASGGFEFRRNSAAVTPDAQFASGDVLGFGAATPLSGSINVYEGFGEILIPLLTDNRFAEILEIEAGGRVSNYSTSGTVWTWKAGGQWVPFDGLRFRGMWQRAVRAPNTSELFLQPVFFSFPFPGAFDFCSASNDPVGRGLGDICVAQGMNPAQLGVYDSSMSTLQPTFRLAGNPNLDPERANTITAAPNTHSMRHTCCALAPTIFRSGSKTP